MVRIEKFSPENVNPEIAAMVKEILDPFAPDEVHRGSEEVAAVYNWCKNKILDMISAGKMAVLPETPKETKERIKYRKARQKEIFGLKRPKTINKYDDMV